MRRAFVGPVLLAVLGYTALTGPATADAAVVVAQGVFADDAYAACGGTETDFHCHLYINTVTGCAETPAGTVGVLGDCYLRFDDGDPLVLRGTAARDRSACTTMTHNLRPTDTHKLLVVHSPTFGDIDVGVNVTYGGTTGSGHGTLYGIRFLLGHTIEVDATITNILGCSQDSGVISGTYTITS